MSQGMLGMLVLEQRGSACQPVTRVCVLTAPPPICSRCHRCEEIHLVLCSLPLNISPQNLERAAQNVLFAIGPLRDWENVTLVTNAPRKASE